MNGHDPRFDAGRAALIAQLDEAAWKEKAIRLETLATALVREALRNRGMGLTVSVGYRYITTNGDPHDLQEGCVRVEIVQPIDRTPFEPLVAATTHHQGVKESGGSPRASALPVSGESIPR
jgi:hypothetical protein